MYIDRLPQKFLLQKPLGFNANKLLLLKSDWLLKKPSQFR